MKSPKDTSESSPFEWILANNLNFIVGFESQQRLGGTLSLAPHTIVYCVLVLP